MIYEEEQSEGRWRGSSVAFQRGNEPGCCRQIQVPFYADVGSGGGTTNVTWQGILGVGKTFEKWIDASLAYRYMYYDMKGDGLLQKTTFKGPQLAVTFKF